MRSQDNIVYGPQPTIPIADGTAGKFLLTELKKYIGIPSFVTEPETGLTMSYKELLETTSRLAQSIINNGYLPNTVISICSENNVYYMCPVIAALYTGLVTAPLNPNYTERELLHTLNISKPTIVFCSNQTLNKIIQIKAKLSYIQRIVLLDSKEDISGVQTLQNFINTGCGTNFDVEKFKTVDFDRDEQIALIMCSSGTTGLPKGVMLTHKHLMIRFMHCRDPEYGTAMFVKKAEAILNFMPLFHNFGFMVTLGYIMNGFHIIQMQRYTEVKFLESLEKYHVRSTLVVPPIMIFLIKNKMVQKYNLSSLEEIGCGAAPLSNEVIVEVRKRLNVKIVRQGYGLTEATLLAAIHPTSSKKLESSGKLLPLISAKIIDLDTGKPLGPNQPGEIWLRGDLIMKGYMGNIEETQSVIDKDGWFHTGDVGYYDDDEYFHVVDRIKELIKYNGYQVAPAELEALLLEHPCVKEVAVVGKPDYVAGELPTAFIVTQAGKSVTADEIYRFLEGKISPEKRLRGGVIFIDAIPRNSTGKILRRELRFQLENNSKL